MPWWTAAPCWQAPATGELCWALGFCGFLPGRACPASVPCHAAEAVLLAWYRPAPSPACSSSNPLLIALLCRRDAADFLLPLLLPRPGFKGVCYYDEGKWMVLDLQRRRLPRDCSPIRESQAFTIFDEARCRGADLQLRPDAVGLLTLGPATCKDKLMQVGGCAGGWVGGRTCG